MKQSKRAGLRALAASVMAATILAGCGGGGGSAGECLSGSAATCGSGPVTTVPPQAMGSEALANICTAEGMKQFTRAYLGEVYLWYNEIPAINAADYSTLDEYFYNLLTPQIDDTGRFKDRFSFIVTNTDADSLLTGINTGYGVRWETDERGRERVAFVDAGSPALEAGLSRGGELVDVLTPGASWYPNAQESIRFTYRATPDAATRTVTLNSATVREDPVPWVDTLASPSGRKIAYLLFNAHTRGAQDELIPALSSAQAAGAQDLVIDMRYNGGGFLYTAIALGSMITGASADGRIFEKLQYNDKRPFSTRWSETYFDGTVQYAEPGSPVGTLLPRLGLRRVFVLTGSGTCSASEAVINGLRGVGVEVVIIGQPTCGKPYGFARRDNCGVSYFPIEFQGVNALGFGAYASGFAPTCPMADDFDHALGDKNERLLSAALSYADTGICPASAGSLPLSARVSQRSLSWPVLRGKVVPTPPRP